MGYALGQTDAVLSPGRLVVCYVDAVRKWGVYIYSIYHWRSNGVSMKNGSIFELLARHTGSHGSPWVAGCDYHVLAEAMRKSPLPRALQISLVAPLELTCTAGKAGSIIDHFLVDRLDWVFFEEASAHFCAKFKPHYPVEVGVSPGWHQATGFVHCAPAAFPRQASSWARRAATRHQAHVGMERDAAAGVHHSTGTYGVGRRVSNGGSNQRVLG